MKLGLINKIVLLFVALFGFQAHADESVDLKNGAELYKKCALCHGQFGQGVSGGIYPRVAGMPDYYSIEQMEKYIKGNRSDDFSLAMLEVGGLKNMDEKQMKDLAAFMAAIDLDKHYPLTIPKPTKGDPAKGKDLFKDDCKRCHNKKAQGKKKKDTPSLAGQYTDYLKGEVKSFKVKDRHHDNDPEDEAFDDYTKAQLDDIFAYVATLKFEPEKGYATMPEDAMLAMTSSSITAKPGTDRTESSGNTQNIKIESVTQTVLKMALSKDMSIEDSIDAMLSKAAEHNMKDVGRQKVSQELKNRGIDSPHLEIFQFCAPEDAMKMVRYDTIFAAYMPCRIALVEDNKGKIWVEMLNLDMVINSVALPPHLNKIAIETNGKMLDILTAGATGAF